MTPPLRRAISTGLGNPRRALPLVLHERPLAASGDCPGATLCRLVLSRALRDPRLDERAPDVFRSVEPYDPADDVDAPAVRARLGYAPDQALILIAVGGAGIGDTASGVGRATKPATGALLPCARSRTGAVVGQP